MKIQYPSWPSCDRWLSLCAQRARRRRTLDSFKEPLRGLFERREEGSRAPNDAEDKLHEARPRWRDFASASKASGIAEDVTGYGSSGFGYGSDIPRTNYAQR